MKLEIGISNLFIDAYFFPLLVGNMLIISLKVLWPLSPGCQWQCLGPPWCWFLPGFGCKSSSCVRAASSPCPKKMKWPPNVFSDSNMKKWVKWSELLDVFLSPGRSYLAFNNFLIQVLWEELLGFLHCSFLTVVLPWSRLHWRLQLTFQK